MQFVFGTCDATRCIHAESLVDPLLFLLDIFTFRFLHIKDIIELGRAEELRFIRLNTTDIKKYSTPWEHEGDCFEDESSISLYYQHKYFGRKKTQLAFSLEIEFKLSRLSSGL